MNTFIVEPDEEVMKLFISRVEDLIQEFELTQGEVFCFASMYSVFASDQMELGRQDFLMNSANFWDFYSARSKSHHRKNMQ